MIDGVDKHVTETDWWHLRQQSHKYATNSRTFVLNYMEHTGFDSMKNLIFSSTQLSIHFSLQI